MEQKPDVEAPAAVCPECGCDDVYTCQTEVTGIETYYKCCSDCGEIWDIE